VGGVGDFFEALEGDLAGGMEGDHVGEDDVGVDVFGVLEVVFGVEGGGDVPPEAVVLGKEPADEGFGMLDAVVFEIEDGVVAVEDGLRALENLEFVAFDVDFDEGDGLIGYQRIERIARDSLRVQAGGEWLHRGSAEVAGLGVVGRGEVERAELIRAGVGEGGDVAEAVEGEVGAELLEDHLLGFEGEHAAALVRELLGDGDGVDAHVGAGFDDRAMGGLGVGEELKEGFDFELAALAVVQEGLAHVDVVAVDEHGAVAGGQELVVGSDGNALHGNLLEARTGPLMRGNCWRAVRTTL
jgi:hypothetical protein